MANLQKLERIAPQLEWEEDPDNADGFVAQVPIRAGARDPDDRI